MLLGELIRRKAWESAWKRQFMEEAIRAGLSFNASEKLAKSERAVFLRDSGYSGVEAYLRFEE